MKARIKKLSKKISANTKNSRFPEPAVQNILELLLDQYPIYDNLQYIGHGGFALVLKATIKKQKDIALKIVEYDQNLEIERTKNEYQLLKSVCKSQYFVNVNKTFYLKEENEFQKEEDDEEEKEEDEDEEEQNLSENENKQEKQVEYKYYVMEMELCACSFNTFLQQLKKDKISLDSHVKEKLALQMLDSLNLLHSKNVIHRDIKPENFLISNSTSKDTPFILKLSDLGLASQLFLKNSKSFLSGVKGTTNYMSLESQNGESRKESDLYSFGIVLLELDNYEKFNYSSVTLQELALLQSQGIDALKSYKLNLNTLISKVATEFLNPDYKKRSSAREMMYLFLKNEQNKSLPLFSIIIQNQIQCLELDFSYKNEKEQEQIQILKSSVSHLPQLQKSINIALLNIDKKKLPESITIDSIRYILNQLYQQGKYDQLSILGAGTQAVLISALNVSLKRECALKLYFKQNKAEIMREVAVMQRCRSPYIVQFYGYEFIKDSSNQEFVILELEKCRCTLDQYLNQQTKEKQYSSEQKINIALQIMDSVNLSHKSRVIHGDIKLENFLITEDEQNKVVVKLSDFNQSGFTFQSVSEQEENKFGIVPFLSDLNVLFNNGRGNLVYYSPERFFHKSNPSSFQSDCFAVGMCLLLVDNYIQFSSKLFQNYNELLSSSENPFKNSQHLFNVKSSIYQWATQLLIYSPYQRYYLNQIISCINKPPIPLYSLKKKEIDLSTDFFYHQQRSLIYSIDFPLDNVVDPFSKIQKLSPRYLSLSYPEEISNKYIEKFSKSLSQLTQLQHLEINIGIEDGKYLFEELSKLSQLSSLSLELGSQSINSEFFEGLSKVSKLSSLSLNLINEISMNVWKSLSKSVSQLNLLTVLSIKYNKIVTNQEEDLQIDLSHLSMLSSCHIFSIKNDSDKKYFSLNLSNLQSLQSLFFILQQNGTRVIEQLEKNLYLATSLSSLTLVFFNNEITNQSFNKLSLALSKFSSLESLMLAFNQKIENEVMKSFSKNLILLHQLSSLHLLFGYSKIGNEESQLLSTGLSNLKSLSSLTLFIYNNNIEDKGLEYIFNGITSLDSIVYLTLDLSYPSLARDASTLIFDCLSKLSHLQYIEMKRIQSNLREQLEFSLQQFFPFAKIDID